MILGIDTSNYTTSAAVLDGEALTQQKQLLEVRPGERGLRHGQLHHAQIGGQVPAVMGHSLHQQIADLRTQLFQLITIHFFQVLRRLNAV
jgi:tRNA A37 threonylcarbamoyltransferase TsaD